MPVIFYHLFDFINLINNLKELAMVSSKIQKYVIHQYDILILKISVSGGHFWIGNMF